MEGLLLRTHFPMCFGWHKSHIKYLYLPLLPSFWRALCLPPNCSLQTSHSSASLFFLEGPPPLIAPFDWLPPVTQESQLSCCHLRKRQFPQSGLGILFFSSLSWTHLCHYMYHVTMQLWILSSPLDCGLFEVRDWTCLSLSQTQILLEQRLAGERSHHEAYKRSISRWAWQISREQ